METTRQTHQRELSPLSSHTGSFPGGGFGSIGWYAVLAVVVHLASASFHVLAGGMSADEGFYAIGTRAVAHGEVPYRDFGFTQPPLVLYVNALPLRAIGFGLFQQRALNGVWGALALLFAAKYLARRVGSRWAVALALFFSLSPPWMHFIHLGKTYGVASLLVMLAAWIFLVAAPGFRRNFLLGLLGALGLGARLPSIPFFAVLWLFALWPGRRPTFQESVALVTGIGAGVALVFLPFWIVAPEQAKFWIVDFHRLSVPTRDWNLSARDLFSLGPLLWLLTALTLGLAAWRRRLIARETGIMLAALAGLAVNLLPTGSYEEYGVPFLLPLALGAVVIVADELKSRSRLAVATFACSALAIHGVIGPALSHSKTSPLHRAPHWWLPAHAEPFAPSLASRLSVARRIVEQSLPPDAPLIGSNIILAAETGRAVPPNLRMGPFSFTVEIPPAQASRLHLATHEELDAWFAQREVTLLAFFKRRELNYGWSMPSFDQLRPEFHAQWFAPVRRDFATAYEGEEFVLLVRRPVP